MIHSQFLDPETVYDIYNEDVPPNRVEKADIERAEMFREMGFASVLQGVTVNELWMLPNRRHPDGIYCVWAGKDILYGPTKFPYDHKRLPFTLIGAVPRPNSQFHSSPVTFLRAPQVELNKYHAQKIANREAWANLKLLMPPG